MNPGMCFNLTSLLVNPELDNVSPLGWNYDHSLAFGNYSYTEIRKNININQKIDYNLPDGLYAVTCEIELLCRSLPTTNSSRSHYATPTENNHSQ